MRVTSATTSQTRPAGAAIRTVTEPRMNTRIGRAATGPAGRSSLLPGQEPPAGGMDPGRRAGSRAGGVVRQAWAMSVPFPEPTTPVATRAGVFLGYLDYFRSRLVSKLEALPDGEPRRSRLPSGWTPAELLQHLTYVELRWLDWGFEGRDVTDP